MKNLTKTIAVVAAVLLAASNAFAVPTTVSSSPISINASVNGTLTLTVDLRKNTATGPGAVAAAMNFGNLAEFSFTNPTTGVVTKSLRSSDTTGTAAFTALITANSHQLPYTIKQTAGPLTVGSNSIPTGACAVKPIITTQDNGGAAVVGTIGTAGSWVQTDKVLYTSDSVGSIRTIQAIYSITDDPAAGGSAAVPINQAGGAYTSQVTFTVTA